MTVASGRRRGTTGGRAVFGIISVAVAIGCVRLGFWQLARLDQRQALNAAAAAERDREPLDLRDADSAAVYRRVAASGVYDTSVTVVEVLRAWNGAPGVYVVSPLMLGDGRAVLVERGWAGAPDGRSVDVAAMSWPDSVRVEGFVTPVLESNVAYDGRWPEYVRGADPVAVSRVVGYRVLPILVRRTGGPDHSAIRPLEPPVLTNGPHLSYAIQWFAFAVVAVVGSAIYLLRGRSGEQGGADPIDNAEARAQSRERAPRTPSSGAES